MSWYVAMRLPATADTTAFQLCMQALSSLSPRLALAAHAGTRLLLLDGGRLHGRRLLDLIEQIQVLARPHAGNQFALGLAEHLLVAKIVACTTPPATITLVRPDDEARFLAPLPIELLGLEHQLCTRLHQFGLHTIGTVAACPALALQNQFGAAGSHLAALARGQEERVLPTLVPAPHCLIGQRFPEPIQQRGVLEQILKRLCQRLSERLLQSGAAATALSLICESAWAAPLRANRQLPNPTSDPYMFYQASMNLLNSLVLPDSVSTIMVLATNLRTLQSQQALLFPELMQSKHERLEALADRLPGHLAARLVQAQYQPNTRCLERQIVLAPLERQ